MTLLSNLLARQRRHGLENFISWNLLGLSDLSSDLSQVGKVLELGHS